MLDLNFKFSFTGISSVKAMAIYSSLCTESLLSPSSYHSALLGGQLHDHMSLTSVIMSLHSGAAPGRAFSNSTKKSQWQNSEVPISLLVFFHSVLLMVPPTCAGNQMTEQERRLSLGAGRGILQIAGICHFQSLTKKRCGTVQY